MNVHFGNGYHPVTVPSVPTEPKANSQKIQNDTWTSLKFGKDRAERPLGVQPHDPVVVVLATANAILRQELAEEEKNNKKK